MPRSGTMQVTTPKGRWLVPPDRAVWVPARLVHAIDVLADIEMRTLYFDARLAEARAAQREPRPGIRGAGLAAAASGDPGVVRRATTTAERTALLVRLAMLELHRADDSATFIPLPQRAALPPRRRHRAAPRPPPRMTSRRWRRKVGTSARTLSRLFAAETQLSFKSWCQRARIAAAIERLSIDANVSVKQLAADLGYASVPAFSHAFRQVTGKTPTEFVDAE